MNFNTNLFFAIFNQSGKLVAIDALMIFGAEYLIFIIVFAVILAFFSGGNREKKALILTILSLILTFLFIKFIHLFLNTPRPFLENNIKPLIKMNFIESSFPSTHSAVMAAIACSYFLARSKLAIFLILTMILVGFCRIFVGVHYPLDIFGGFIVGILSTVLIANILNHLVKLRF